MKYAIAFTACLWLAGNCLAESLVSSASSGCCGKSEHNLGCDESGCGRIGCDDCGNSNCGKNDCNKHKCGKKTCADVCCSSAGSCDIDCTSFCTKKKDCCCLRCCCQWRVTSEFLFLRRGDADDFTIITDQNTGGELLNVTGLNFDHEITPRFFLTRELSSCWGFDIGFMGLDSWNTFESRGDPISPTLIGPGNIPFVSAAPGTVFRVDYSTDFFSGEFNIRRRCNERVTWLAGFRMVELSDFLLGRSTAPTTQNFYTVDTNNHLYGFQLGTDMELVKNCQQKFHIAGIFRAGVFYNNLDQNTNIPVIPTNISTSDDHTSFLGEIGIRGVYDLNCRLSITGGYHILWLEGLALAPDQLPVTNVITPSLTTLDTGGSLFFHGAAIGVQLTY